MVVVWLMFVLSALLVTTSTASNGDVNSTVMVHIREFVSKQRLLRAAEQGTTSKTPSFLIYIVSHDEASFEIARNYSATRSWARPLIIHNTKFFESALFHDYLPHQYDDWQGMDYVGMMSYTVAIGSQRLGSDYHADDIDTLLPTAFQQGYDVVPFYRSNGFVLAHAVHYHGKAFVKAWNNLLYHMGFPEPVVRQLDPILAFYRNAFVCRPAYMVELVALMSDAMNRVIFDPDLHALFAINSGYPGAREVAEKVFRKPYYELHPFVFERLVVFFVHALEARVCHSKGRHAAVCPSNT
jgi:hypothetical protein